MREKATPRAQPSSKKVARPAVSRQPTAARLQAAIGNQAVLGVLRSGGDPLPASVRSFFEPRLASDFAGVRMHTDARAAESARAVNALAYTVGEHIVFGEGAFAPESAPGRRLLAHELTHTIQQRGADRGTVQRAEHLPVSRSNDPAELEAERVADRVLASPPTAAPPQPKQTGLQIARFDPPDRRPRTEFTQSGSPGTVEGTSSDVTFTTGVEGSSRSQTLTGADAAVTLDYHGRDVAHTGWLQFGWVDITGVDTSGGSGRLAAPPFPIPSTGGDVLITGPREPPRWFLDEANLLGVGLGPFYDQGPGGSLDNRTATSTTIVDVPFFDHSAFDNLANQVLTGRADLVSVTFTSHFSSFVVRRGRAVEQVDWQCTITYTRPVTPGGIRHCNIVSQPTGVRGLPGDLLRVLRRSAGRRAAGIR